MSSIALAVAVLSFTGCLWATPRSDTASGFEARVISTDTAHPGAALHTEYGMAGLYFAAEADVHGVRRDGDPNTYTGTMAGMSLRASPFGIIGSMHELDRYLDFGAEAGVGAAAAWGVPTKVAGYGEAWYGAWVELGTVPLQSGYLVVTGTLRAVSASDAWRDQTQIMIGVGWRQRRQVTESDLRIRD